MAAHTAHRPESDRERLDRELEQLLQELRVAMPGVQVLFAFLLAVPFQQRFTIVTPLQRTTYFVTLLAAGAASALFIAPTAYHRIVFRRGDKARLVRLATRLTIVGLAALALAMVGAVMLVTDILFGTATVVVTVSAATALFGWLWFGLAARRRLTHGGDRI